MVVSEISLWVVLFSIQNASKTFKKCKKSLVKGTNETGGISPNSFITYGSNA